MNLSRFTQWALKIWTPLHLVPPFFCDTWLSARLARCRSKSSTFKRSLRGSVCPMMSSSTSAFSWDVTTLTKSGTDMLCCYSPDFFSTNAIIAEGLGPRAPSSWFRSTSQSKRSSNTLTQRRTLCQTTFCTPRPGDFSRTQMSRKATRWVDTTATTMIHRPRESSVNTEIFCLAF